MIRPAEHLVHGVGGPVVVVDGRVCALMNRLLGLDKIRTRVRGQDAQLDQTLLAIKLAAVATESAASGTTSAPQPEPRPSSEKLHSDTVSTTTAADMLNLTDRAIRKAITEKRLQATKLDGRYRIHRDDLTNYIATQGHR